ncbi:MAG: hypothetical protein NTW52_00520 [Planctomycetota bacterium]|nr:hypothetical protein [Planctomycetota bacterium]
MRQLYIIPIVHTAADLGLLEEQVEQVKRLRFSQETINEGKRRIDQFWTDLRESIEAWELNYSQLLVFQDALPTVGKLPNRAGNEASIHDGLELRICRDLAGKGSANHQLLLWLVDHGATLVGTESPELLVMEYEIVRKSLLQMDELSNPKIEMETELASLLHRRDQFIAKRIDETLQEGQSAFLFIGMLHDVAKLLPSDLTIEFPFGQPNRQQLSATPISKES